MKQLKRALPLVIIIALWTLLSVGVFIQYNYHPNGAGDFTAYHKAAVAISEGRTPYIDLEASMPYLYPPFFAQVLSPVVAINPDFRFAANTWFLINMGLLAGSIWMIGKGRAEIWLTALLFFAWYQSVLFGQVTVLLLFLAVAGWKVYREEKPILAGVFIVLGAWVKFYPALLLVYFVWKREWRVLVGAVLASAVISIFQISVSGWEIFIGYFRDILPLLAAEGQIGVIHSNNSVLGFAQRLFSNAPSVVPLMESPLLLSVTRYSLTLLLLAALFYVTRVPMRKTSKTTFDVEYGLTLLTALLLGSTLGLHGMLSALLPMCLFRVRLHKLIAAFSILFINLHLLIVIGYLQPGSGNTMPALLLSFPFFGMMILWALLVNIHLRTSAKSNAQTVEIPAAAVTI